MADGNNIINDPHYVPLADHSGTVFATEDGTIIIVSSDLSVRYASTEYGKTKTWLKTPPRYLKGGRR